MSSISPFAYSTYLYLSISSFLLDILPSSSFFCSVFPKSANRHSTLSSYQCSFYIMILRFFLLHFLLTLHSFRVFLKPVMSLFLPSRQIIFKPLSPPHSLPPNPFSQPVYPFSIISFSVNLNTVLSLLLLNSSFLILSFSFILFLLSLFFVHSCSLSIRSPPLIHIHNSLSFFSFTFLHIFILFLSLYCLCFHTSLLCLSV